MNLALIGCGFVGDYYMPTLRNHPNLNVVSVYDRDMDRAKQFCDYYKVRMADNLEDILIDSSIDMVLNLTNPASHFEITRQCLEAGKHVYSEKPLGNSLEEARVLVDLAAVKNLGLAVAPCSMLSETAQTMWKAVREGKIGRVKLVRAYLDEGMIHSLKQHETLITPSGARWPAKDEYEVGCTFEHAGYYLTWLTAMFGSARRVTAHSTCLLHDKGIPVDSMAPDHSFGIIEYDQGVIAEFSNSIVAPHDHSFMVVGEKGILYTNEAWDYGAPVVFRQKIFQQRPKVYVTKRPIVKRILLGLLRRTLGHTAGMIDSQVVEDALPLVRSVDFEPLLPNFRMDFMRGPAELAESILKKRPCRLSAELALHVTDLTIALQYPERTGVPYEPKTTVPEITPMPWAV